MDIDTQFHQLVDTLIPKAFYASFQRVVVGLDMYISLFELFSPLSANKKAETNYPHPWKSASALHSRYRGT